MKRFSFPPSSTEMRQRGVVMVMTAIALVALIGAVGMALDGGHILLSKTRLQNAVDSAALSGAKTLNLAEDYTSAINAAHEIFALNASQSKELFEAYNLDSSRLRIEFSETLTDENFTTTPPLGSKPRFIRAIFENLDLDLWLIQVTGVDSKRVSASAVSGPSPPLIKNVCGIAPILLCEKDSDDPDLFGYEQGKVELLKLSADDDPLIGGGNFQLISLGNGPGAKNVSQNAAGGYSDECLSTDKTVPTEPGNEPMALARGINTRFGFHEGFLKGYEDIYPGDFITTHPDPYLAYDSETEAIIHNDGTVFNGLIYPYDAATYISNSESIISDDPLESEKSPEYRRRIITVPVGECGNADLNGKNDLLVKGFLCLFIVQHMGTPQNTITLDDKARMGIDNTLFAEVINACNANGTFTDTPTHSTSPVNIVLHNDPGRTDS